MKSPKPSLRSRLQKKKDFMVEVGINNNIDTVIVDTGAGVSLCGTLQAKKWGMLSKLVQSKVKLKPYNSLPIPIHGISRCAVTFGATSVPIEWHVISGSCEPILAGDKAIQLGIINFNPTSESFKPIRLINPEIPTV